ncbi:2-phosphosulfolactate phosphatase [Bacillus salitolerans]|uniref:Probable 2-phosphosulfolactate phosphatase n=1 Tax=Bacillus salitolerans TaxID=1437434 RepID=A0ABW4LJR9_9BACI
MVFDQTPYSCRVEWGRRGAREAAERGDIVIIVDVLSFSSTVISALEMGAVIFPYPPHLDGEEYANIVKAEYILGRAEASKRGKATLSPVSFSHEHANKKFVLSSMNGSFCTWIAKKTQAVLVGGILNAEAVASVANQISKQRKASITIIPCGEQWNETREYEDTLRPAVEDYLGAGAILSYLGGDKSPEAKICMAGFLSVREKIEDVIWECGSGRELRERGFDADVKHCIRLNTYKTVPMLQDGYFVDVRKYFT